MVREKKQGSENLTHQVEERSGRTSQELGLNLDLQLITPLWNCSVGPRVLAGTIPVLPSRDPSLPTSRAHSFLSPNPGVFVLHTGLVMPTHRGLQRV